MADVWERFKKLPPTDPAVRVEHETIVADRPSAAHIVEMLEKAGCDLIVMGMHGHSWLRERLFGSLTEEVVRLAHCPVMVVKAPAHKAPAAPPLSPRRRKRVRRANPESPGIGLVGQSFHLIARRNAMKRLRVLLADDHRLLREALSQLLEPCCDVVGTAADGRALLAAAAELRPDIVVLDAALPLLNGLDAARQLRRVLPGVKVIFLDR